MKNKILALALVIGMIISLSGCDTGTILNVSVEGEVAKQSSGFINISDKPIPLAYDSMTRIVYIRNYTYECNLVYTPYYAPNGLPYRYNPETNTFEEIERENK